MLTSLEDAVAWGLPLGTSLLPPTGDDLFMQVGTSTYLGWRSASPNSNEKSLFDESLVLVLLLAHRQLCFVFVLEHLWLLLARRFSIDLASLVGAEL